MSPEQFTFWLQGFFELTDSKNLSPNQVLMIKEHLGLVFNKVTIVKVEEDSLSKEESEKIKKILNESKEKLIKRIPMRPQGNHSCWAHKKIC